MIAWVRARTRTVIGHVLCDRDYTGALVSGYAQMAVNAAVQLAMVPLYLETIGRAGFGLLMVLLALATYIAVGALWLTGGATRTLGEMAARNDRTGFAQVWAAGKTAALIYAGAIAALALAAVALFLGALANRPARCPASGWHLFSLPSISSPVGRWRSTASVSTSRGTRLGRTCWRSAPSLFSSVLPCPCSLAAAVSRASPAPCSSATSSRC